MHVPIRENLPIVLTSVLQEKNPYINEQRKETTSN